MTNAEQNFIYKFLDGSGSIKVQWQGGRPHTFVIFAAFWKKPDGTIVAHQWRTNGRDAESSSDAVFNRLDSYFSAY